MAIVIFDPIAIVAMEVGSDDHYAPDGLDKNQNRVDAEVEWLLPWNRNPAEIFCVQYSGKLGLGQIDREHDQSRP